MPSVADYVFAGAERLTHGPHPDRALRDAEFLMMHVLGKDRAWILAYWRDEIGTDCSIPYHSAIERRRNGEPVQYIVEEAEFYGLPFYVNRSVLIPRPETEHLVEKAIDLAPDFAQLRIVDVGTGSGAIAIALAHKLPASIVTAIDLSPAALEVAKKNALQNGVAQQIRFLEGDLLAPVAGEPFDMIASNPPYIPNVDRDSLAVEVRDYEPAQALFAGPDGLAIYQRLISQAFRALVPGGWIVLEIGYSQQPGVKALLEHAGFLQIAFTPDLQGIPRVASARRG